MSRLSVQVSATTPSMFWCRGSASRSKAIGTLGGLTFGMTTARPEIDTEAVAGAPAIKTGTIEVIVEYETATPLG